MISKIAIFRALQLGDMLCSIPTVRAIRAMWPNAETFLIGLPWQKEFVLRFNRYFDHFLEFPGYPGLPEQPFDPDRVLKFLNHVRTFGFDLVFQMQGNGEITNSLCMLWGAKQVCGLRKPGEYAPDENLFPVSEDTEHEVTRFFKLLNCFEIPHQGTHLEFPLAREENESAQEILKSCGLTPNEFVCVHPGARDPRRRWPVENFADIANRISSHGLPVVLTGSQDEATLLTMLQSKLNGRNLNLVDAFGHLPVGVLAAIIGQSKMLVSNDTGVSHIASAMRTPSVIIFSPHSDFNRWRPLDEQRHVAIPNKEANDPENVVSKVYQVLNTHKPAHAQSTT